MRLFARGFIVFIFIFFCSVFFVSPAFALTTPFRSANIATTDGAVSYTNLNNCSATDTQTCDRALAASQANLYFRDFGTYADFGMSPGSVITKTRIRVTGKTSYAYYVGLSLQIPAVSNCQYPSDLMTGYLGNSAINVQNFVVDVTPSGIHGIYTSCLQPYSFENNKIVFRINYSSTPAWSANIDNFEIAFDYNLGPTPTPNPTPTPTLTPSPTPIPKTPLILIPGIAGSELKTTEMRIWSEDNGRGGTFTNVYPAETIWVNGFQVGLPGEDDYFDILRMQTDGQTSEANLTLSGNLFTGIYQGTIDFFVSNGYTLNKDLFIFPYDWRRDVSLTAPLLDQKINEIKMQTGVEKVDIVAHSMGGLVARNYISDAARALNVRKLFTIGTPHLGSVDSLKNLIYGGCFTIFEQLKKPICIGLSPSEVKDVIRNMISGYELDPSQAYFNFYSGEDNNHPFPYRTEAGPLNYEQIKTLLTSSGYNTPLFNPSEAFHSLDANLSNTNGVDVTLIAGSGKSTLGQIIEEKTTSLLGVPYVQKDMMNINGDGTVPLMSASLVDYNKSLVLLGKAKVFYTNQEHGNLVAFGPALNLVKNILNGESQLPDGVSITPYYFNGRLFSVHSPVNINIYDSLGNHTGPTINGDFEANIPGSSYDTLGDAKFIYLPNNGNYNIKFEATDQGSFDFKIRKYEDNVVSQETLYKDIPLTILTKAETQFDTTSNTSPIVHLDENGNGIIQDVSPTSNLTGDAVLDQTPPQTSIQLSGVLGNNGWYKSDVVVTLNPLDEASGSGILKTEYSLGNGAIVNIYTEPFIISAEKINKLKFRSIDNAGNEENPQEAEIKIDKTAPEAKIFVDPDKQDLVVTGIDTNHATVIKSDNKLTKKRDDAFYTITDEAGNILKLDVRERDKEKQDRFRIYSTQYNNDPIKTLASNYFNITYNGKKQRSNVKEQNFEFKGETKIRIQYDIKKNKSTIIVKEPKGERVKEVRGGLVYLNLLTNKGQLKTSY
ncbi:MAG: Esterase [Candidatus Levybacteria bacterium]|nr:Esterase [Candidatus Levybacteria bacterium]